MNAKIRIRINYFFFVCKIRALYAVLSIGLYVSVFAIHYFHLKLLKSYEQFVCFFRTFGSVMTKNRSQRAKCTRDRRHIVKVGSDYYKIIMHEKKTEAVKKLSD